MPRNSKNETLTLRLPNVAARSRAVTMGQLNNLSWCKWGTQTYFIQPMGYISTVKQPSTLAGRSTAFACLPTGKPQAGLYRMPRISSASEMTQILDCCFALLCLYVRIPTVPSTADKLLQIIFNSRAVKSYSTPLLQAAVRQSIQDRQLKVADRDRWS